MTSCSHCGGPITPENPYRWDPVTLAETCPSCGKKKEEPSHTDSAVPTLPETEPSLVEKYFKDVWKVLTQPTRFFRDLPFRQAPGNLATPLVYAIVTHWIAKALTFLKTMMVGGDTYVNSFEQQIFNRLYSLTDGGNTQWYGKKTSPLLEWFSSLSSVVLDPFITLITVGITALLIYVGIYCLVPKRSINNGYESNFESALILVCYGSTPFLLSPLPFVGSFIAKIYVFIVMILGAKEIYQISTVRSFFVILFPKLLTFGGILVLGMLALGLFSVLLVIPFSLFFS